MKRNAVGGVLMIGLAVACGGPTLPPGPPDVLATFLTLIDPAFGGPELRIGVHDEGAGCNRDVILTSGTDVVRLLSDGTVEKGSLTGLPIGASLHVWTRSPPPACPHAVRAAVLAILPQDAAGP